MSLDVGLLVLGVSVVSLADSQECVRGGTISGGLFWVGGVDVDLFLLFSLDSHLSPGSSAYSCNGTIRSLSI